MNGLTQRNALPSRLPSHLRQNIQGVCLLAIALFLTLLTSCGLLAKQPPTQAVRLAVTQQLTHAQQNIAQSLGRPDSTQPLEPNFKIDRLDITSREQVSEKRFQKQGYPSNIYKVRGIVETTLTAANRKIQQATPFELYLGREDSQKNAPSRSLPSQPNSSASPSSSSANSPADSPADNIETWYLIAPDGPKPPQ